MGSVGWDVFDGPMCLALSGLRCGLRSDRLVFKKWKAEVQGLWGQLVLGS